MELLKKDENPMNRNKGGYYNYKINTTDDVNRTLQRLINDAINKRHEPEVIRLANQLIQTKLQLLKAVELEERISDLEDLLEMDKGEE